MAKKRKKLFTPQNRLRALAREQMISLVSLFNKQFNEPHLLGAASKIRGLAKETNYADLSQEVIDYGDRKENGAKGRARNTGIEVDYSVSQSLRDRVELHSITAHEITHVLSAHPGLHLGKNDFVTAHSIETYLGNLGLLGQYGVGDLATGKELNFFLEQSFRRQAYRETLEALGSPMRAEYVPYLGGKSFADIGKTLGKIALGMEAVTGKPALGLFVIREVSNGAPLQKTLRRALKQDFEKERVRWMTLHSLMRRFILRNGHPNANRKPYLIKWKKDAKVSFRRKRRHGKR